MSFGARLLEERTRLGFSQGDFAVLCSVGKTTQLAYEKETRHPDTLYLIKASATGVDVPYVLFGKRLSREDLADDSSAPSDRALRFAQAFDTLDASRQALVEQICRMAVADSTGVAIPAYLRKLPLPKPRAFPLRTDPEDAYNRYASPDGVQPSPAQLDLRSPAAMFLAEMYDAVPLGARDLVHSLCIKVLRDYEGLTETALSHWAERRAAARPESPERRAPTAEPSPVAGQKK